jgi:amino-acid N-acetyltransferase
MKTETLTGTLRKAKPSDAVQIHELINTYAKEGLLLPVSLNNLYDNIRDFFVFETEEGIVGCAALHITWEDLAEIRSLAVRDTYRGKGIGRKLVKECIKEATELGIKRVFVLTYQIEFFKKLGFREIDKTLLPHKVWTDCLNCPKFPNCDETAMIKELT